MYTMVKPVNDGKTSREIETMIRSMNRTWTESWNETEFRKYIHPDAVAIVPTTPGRLVGQDAYVAGWKGFAESTVIHAWEETGHLVQVYSSGNSAVVTYLFTITFSIAGTRIIMKGRDMFFLVRENGRWLVAADQFSPEPVAA